MKPAFRFINNSGRLNIPVTIRKDLDITETTLIRVTTQDGKIILEKVGRDMSKCWATGNYTDECDCEVCDHRFECSGYDK